MRLPDANAGFRFRVSAAHASGNTWKLTRPERRFQKSVNQPAAPDCFRGSVVSNR